VIEELKQELIKALEHTSDLEDELKKGGSGREEVLQLRSKVRELEAQLLLEKENFAFATKDAEVFQNELADALGKLSVLEGENPEGSLAASTVAKLQARVNDLEEQLLLEKENAEILANDVKLFQSELADALEKLSILEGANSEGSLDVASSTDTLQSRVKDLEEQLQLEKENSETSTRDVQILKSELADVLEKLSVVEEGGAEGALEAQVKDLQDQLLVEKENVDTLTNDVAVLQRELAVALEELSKLE
jgi:hypothetical protein